MNEYHIEHKITTLLSNAVVSDKTFDFFTTNDILFKHWDFNHREGWVENAWIASGNVTAQNFIEAINIFTEKLKKITSRITLIGQAYTESTLQPFLIRNLSNEDGIVAFRFIIERDPVPLMFTKAEKSALDILMENKKVSEEFFYYWRDATNTTGYSAKLLLMFCAIESLSKSLNGKKWKECATQILGDDLCKKIYENKDKGLRHRLIHGEYFSPKDTENYFEEIHKKVIKYFNKHILKDELITTSVISPQRHLFGNKKEGFYFIQHVDGLKVDFKEVLNDLKENDFNLNALKKHKILLGDSFEGLKSSY